MKWEVRTMRFGTSFFNGALYKKTLLRFWPIWAANLVIWGMIMPLNGLLSLRSYLELGIRDRLERFAWNAGDSVTSVGVIFALAAGLLTAMAVFSHLYTARAANFMGALPVRREGQFVSFYLAGLTALVAPNVVIFLLTLLVEAVGGAVYLIPLGWWLLAMSVMELFFFSFAVCLGQFTGHILALPVYYGVFNALAIAVFFLLQLIMESFFYGFSGFSGGWEALVYWCTPAVVFSLLDCEVYRRSGEVIQQVEGLGALAVYAAAALVLTVCALLIFRRRHLESAGDVVAVKVMRPVFKYGVSLCAGLFLGLVTTYVTSVGSLGFMAAILLWGIAGYFVAQMFLDKTFRVLRKWKGAAAVTGVFLLMFLVVGLDLIGFETRVPDADEVAEVQIVGLNSGVYDDAYRINETVSDPAMVEKIVAVHQAAVDRRSTEDDFNSDSEYWDVALCYTLKNGSVIRREYSIWDSAENADVPGTFWYAAEQLMADREFIRAAYGFDTVEQLETQGARLLSAQYDSEKYADKREDGNIGVFYSGAAEELFQAVRADFSDGNIGRDSARRDEEEAVGLLTFTWTVPADAVRYETTEIFVSAGDFTEALLESETDNSYYLSILVTEDAARTLAVLEGLDFGK